MSIYVPVIKVAHRWNAGGLWMVAGKICRLREWIKVSLVACWCKVALSRQIDPSCSKYISLYISHGFIVLIVSKCLAHQPDRSICLDGMIVQVHDIKGQYSILIYLFWENKHTHSHIYYTHTITAETVFHMTLHVRWVYVFRYNQEEDCVPSNNSLPSAHVGSYSIIKWRIWLHNSCLHR